MDNELADQASRLKLTLIDMKPFKMHSGKDKNLTQEQILELQKKVKQLENDVERVKFDLDNSIALLTKRLNTTNEFDKHLTKFDSKQKAAYNTCKNLINYNNNDNINEILQVVLNTVDENGIGTISTHECNDFMNLIIDSYELQEESQEKQTNITNMTRITALLSQILVTTRSKLSHKKQEELKHKYVEPEAKRISEKRRIRDEIFKELFKYNDYTIFQPEKFRDYQRTDDICRFVYKYLKSPQIFTTDSYWKEKKMDVMNYNYWVISNLENNNFRINKNKIVEIYVYNKMDKIDNWVHLTPILLIPKILHVAHQNHTSFHFGPNQTLDNICHRYWWLHMASDVVTHCKECLICQAIKGVPVKKAPLQIRELPSPRVHIMLDLLGPIYFKYYILVIVDYFTGYTVLRGIANSGAEQIADELINNWIPTFGIFEKFESDYGSGFNNELMARLGRAFNIEIHYSEPRNHQGIGKVERVIGVLQKILNAANVQLNHLFTSKNKSESKAWKAILSLLPFIQFGLNQKRSRFTTISANMLMFGDNMKNVNEYETVINELKENLKENDTYYEYVKNLMQKLEFMRKQYTNDWKNYTWLTKQYYDKKNKIATKNESEMKKIQIGTKVLYYVGDISRPQSKWQQKWTGPWKVISKLDDHRTLIISDQKDYLEKRVSIDRIKLFNEGKGMILNKEFEKEMKSKIKYNELK